MPAATQNDVNMDWAKKIAESGVKYYIEVANMPTTNDALEFLKEQKHMVVAPSKAVNAGGVSVSELEMAQNAERLYWTAEEVDAKLKGIMKNIYHSSPARRAPRARPGAGPGANPRWVAAGRGGHGAPRGHLLSQTPRERYVVTGPLQGGAGLF